MKDYIVTLCAVSVAVALFNCLLPEGSVRKYALTASSVMISLAIALPAVKLFDKDFSVSIPKAEYYGIDYDPEIRYKEALRAEYTSYIEKRLEAFGRVYVTVDEDFNVSSIEIYATRTVNEDEKEKIRSEYLPESLEVYYENNQ